MEAARSKRDEARNMANTSDVLLERLAEAQKNEERKLDAARDVVRNARRTLSDAEDALSNAEKDARKAFYNAIRASGKEPLTEPRGFFSWF